ncbi:NAD(P)(+)--arginine ADP-ribosyltransferase 2-like [Sardina pilchardus]|uniref:NAD(P)(+)--arginine ADP-ribosyltransferase 2-like n=1 Tax=Sardina pilchardus TaxID=27697 RepID=UPI002E15ED37
MKAHILMLVMVTTTMGYRVLDLYKAWPLDIAPNSIDDIYSSCTEEMSDGISGYLANDMNANPDFKIAWKNAEKNNKHTNPENNLTVNHMIAIRVYVSGGRYEIYNKFNAAVREGRNIYKTTKFTYKALHFLLTDALKLLKENQQQRKNQKQKENRIQKENQKQCMTTYRRTNVDFDTNVKEIRFGSFTSTSLSKDLDRFGDKSCFQIYTCHGAALGNYSHLPKEEEVLIPPYEKFRVVRDKRNAWCREVYKLTSTGILSNLDCALYKTLYA